MSGVLRADLHVHSYHSGYARHLRVLRARDCYSEPEAVYAAARARGMDVVTITDHDSIDGCLEFLNRHPDAEDFFISEEVECSFPGTTLKAHIGAYAIDERIHREIQPLRSDVHDVVAYLRSRDVFYALNHPFFFFTGQMPFAEYVAMLVGLFPALEVRNGTMLPEHNLLAQAIVSACGAQGGPPFVMIGGSDAHTLAGVATTFTEVTGRDEQEEREESHGSPRDRFVRGLRAGRARADGRHGSTLREAREIYGVVARYWASLVGGGRPGLSLPRRALGLAFSAVTLPFEFSPLLVAALDKRAEAARVRAYRREWDAAAATPTGAAAIANLAAESEST